MTMKEIDGIPVFGSLESEQALEQIKNCAKDAYGCALMADHHLGYAVPIGGVVAYENAVSPSGVGFDIACGNKAVRLDADSLVHHIKPAKTHPDLIYERSNLEPMCRSCHTIKHKKYRLTS